jgi:hypothetical protein
MEVQYVTFVGIVMGFLRGKRVLTIAKALTAGDQKFT